MRMVWWQRSLTLLLLGVGLIAWVMAEGKESPLFFGALRPIPPQKVPKGLSSLSAEACKDCHKDIYEQWRRSQHSKAMTGFVWQAMWISRRKAPFCLNCHAPLAQQRPGVLAGFKESGPLPRIILRKRRFNAKLMREGVTCAVCHIRNGRVLGPRRYSPEELEKIPHPVAYDKRLTQPEFCLSCHIFSFPRVRLEFAACDGDRDYYAYAGEAKTSCQACHMPETEGVVGIDAQKPQVEFPVRRYRDHSIGAFARDPEGLRESFELRVWTEKDDYHPGETVRAEIVLINARAGHMAPTSCGAREIHLVVLLENEQGSPYRKRVFRIGRGFAFPDYPSETEDTRLRPGEARTYHYTARIPKAWVGQSVTLVVRLLYFLVAPRVADKLALPIHKVVIPVYEEKIALK